MELETAGTLSGRDVGGLHKSLVDGDPDAELEQLIF